MHINIYNLSVRLSNARLSCPNRGMGAPRFFHFSIACDDSKASLAENVISSFSFLILVCFYYFKPCTCFYALQHLRLYACTHHVEGMGIDLR